MIWYLKPCPFCGGAATLYTVEQPDGRDTFAVDCNRDECGVNPSTCLYETEAEAVTVWNRRSYE